MVTKIRQLRAHLGGVAREARLRASMTQQDVAQSVDIATEVYGRIERGQMLPSVSTLRRLCRTLGVSANALLGVDEGKEVHPRLPTQSLVHPEDPPELRRLLHQLLQLEAPAVSALHQVASVMSRVKGGEER